MPSFWTFNAPRRDLFRRRGSRSLSATSFVATDGDEQAVHLHGDEHAKLSPEGDVLVYLGCFIL
jgi:hypothetical protein